MELKFKTLIKGTRVRIIDRIGIDMGRIVGKIGTIKYNVGMQAFGLCSNEYAIAIDHDTTGTYFLQDFAFEKLNK